MFKVEHGVLGVWSEPTNLLSLVKRFPAAAGAFSIRVLDLESFALEAIIEVYLAAFHVSNASVIHQKRDASAL